MTIDAEGTWNPKGTAIGEASQDFWYTTFHNLLLEVNQWPPSPNPTTLLGQLPIQSNLTPASKLFRLRAVTNYLRPIKVTLWTLDVLKQISQDPAKPTADKIWPSPKLYGTAIGSLLAHEVGHQLGLYDTYVYSENT